VPIETSGVEQTTQADAQPGIVVVVALVEPWPGEALGRQPAQPDAGELGEADVEPAIGQHLEPQAAPGPDVERSGVAGMAVLEGDQVDAGELTPCTGECFEGAPLVLGVEDLHVRPSRSGSRR
jgi:hypothetical protein